MVPSAQAEADCIRIMADPSADSDVRTACRAVIAAAQARTLVGSAHIDVLARYVRQTYEQDRYGK